MTQTTPDFSGLRADRASVTFARMLGRPKTVLARAALALWGASAGLALAAPGELDGSFGAGGKSLVHLGGVDIASAVALQPDGRIVVAGSTAASGNSNMAVARLLPPQGTLDLRRRPGWSRRPRRHRYRHRRGAPAGRGSPARGPPAPPQRHRRGDAAGRRDRDRGLHRPRRERGHGNDDFAVAACWRGAAPMAPSPEERRSSTSAPGTGAAPSLCRRTARSSSRARAGPTGPPTSPSSGSSPTDRSTRRSAREGERSWTSATTIWARRWRCSRTGTWSRGTA